MNSLNTSINTLCNNGKTHFAIVELITPVNIKAFQRLYREYVARYLGPTITFRSIWFKTDRGLMFAMNGDRAAVDVLPVLLEQAIQKEIISTVEVVYSGHGKLSFIRTLAKALLLYVKLGRSYGSHK